MKKENILVVVLICIAVAGIMMAVKSKTGQNTAGGITDGGAAGIQDGLIDWQDYTQGMAVAKASDKPIFLYFHAVWCTYCTKLKKTTFTDKKVLAYLKDNFISISVDTDKHRDLADQWKVRGLPTLWFLAPDSSKISNIPGYVDAKQLLNILEYIHTKSYQTMKFHDFVKSS